MKSHKERRQWKHGQYVCQSCMTQFHAKQRFIFHLKSAARKCLASLRAHAVALSCSEQQELKKQSAEESKSLRKLRQHDRFVETEFYKVYGPGFLDSAIDMDNNDNLPPTVMTEVAQQSTSPCQSPAA